MGISAMGFFILVEKDKKVRDAVDIFFDPSILMCIAGIIIFMLGFFGCLGALRENICLLKTVSNRICLTVYGRVCTVFFLFYYTNSATFLLINMYSYRPNLMTCCIS